MMTIRRHKLNFAANINTMLSQRLTIKRKVAEYSQLLMPLIQIIGCGPNSFNQIRIYEVFMVSLADCVKVKCSVSYSS